MTERKPAGTSFESFAERQIREAIERGDFDDLPGHGKPLKGVSAPYDELWWVKDKLRREGVSLLPPTLALRKEAEEALTAARGAPSPEMARRIILEVNDKIRAACNRPLEGPPLKLRPFDVEEVVGEWYAAHPGRARRLDSSAAATDRPRRHWWKRAGKNA